MVDATPASAGDHSVTRRGLYWTFVAYGMTGLAGLSLNYLIVSQFGVTTLGRYNTLIAVILIGGQLGSASVHSSVLYHTPEARSTGHPTGQILVSGLALTALTTALSTTVIVGLGEIAFRVADNPDYLNGLRAIAPGLLLYPINKTLLSHLNGLRRIRAFSVAFAGRFVLLTLLAAAAAFLFNDERLLPWTITATEVALLSILLVTLRSELGAEGRRTTLNGLIGRHLGFGLRGIVGGLLLDLNTRVDILLLVAIAGSRAAGVYSIASLFAEGLLQLAMVARYSFDPVVTHLFVEDRLDELRGTIKRVKSRVYFLVFVAIVLSNLCYPLIVRFLFGTDLANESWQVFALLTCGIAFSAGYVPFTNLLQQIGSPARQSLLLGMVGGTNVVLNLLLIPQYGIVGAAAATAIAQACLVPYMRVLARPLLGYSL